eukprot:8395521-Ditylum_brightwellii.AAC.1
MNIDLRRLEMTNCVLANKLTPILFYVKKKKTKLSPSDNQAYKLCTNSKDDKSAVYLLMIGIYNAGALKEWLQFMDAIKHTIKGKCVMDLDTTYMLVKSLLHRNALQVIQSKEENHKDKDSPAFTICLTVVTKHVFPTNT